MQRASGTNFTLHQALKNRIGPRFEDHFSKDTEEPKAHRQIDIYVHQAFTPRAAARSGYLKIVVGPSALRERKDGSKMKKSTGICQICLTFVESVAPFALTALSLLLANLEPFRLGALACLAGAFDFLPFNFEPVLDEAGFFFFVFFFFFAVFFAGCGFASALLFALASGLGFCSYLTAGRWLRFTSSYSKIEPDCELELKISLAEFSELFFYSSTSSSSW